MFFTLPLCHTQNLRGAKFLFSCSTVSLRDYNNLMRKICNIGNSNTRWNNLDIEEVVRIFILQRRPKIKINIRSYFFGATEVNQVSKI